MKRRRFFSIQKTLFSQNTQGVPFGLLIHRSQTMILFTTHFLLIQPGTDQQMVFSLFHSNLFIHTLLSFWKTVKNRESDTSGAPTFPQKIVGHLFFTVSPF